MVAIHAGDKCHMLVALGWLLPHYTCGDPPWFHVAPAHGAMWHHAKCHSTPRASKSVKFRLSRNPTKLHKVARFCEMVPKVKSVLSSEISKISRFLPLLFRQNYRFAIFNFLGFYILFPLKEFPPKIPTCNHMQSHAHATVMECYQLTKERTFILK